MTKKEIFEILAEYPEDFEVVFTQEDEKNRGEHSEMYLDSVTDNKGDEYVHFYFKWTKSSEAI